MAEFKHLIFRASKKPSISLPFGARSAGHFRISGGTREMPRKKMFLQLFWGISGKGEFTHERKKYILEPELIFCYFPGDTHMIKALSEEWEYRWFTMDGPLNKQIIQKFGLKNAICNAGPCPENLFIQLEASIRDITPNGERRASSIAYSIIANACGSRTVIMREDTAVKESLDMIEEECTAPDFTVSGIAEKLNLHRTAFSRLFKHKMGMCPQEYVNLLRLQKAMSLLKETDLRISEIAYRTGYRDPNYFSRIFRLKTGMVPSVFRKG